MKAEYQSILADGIEKKYRKLEEDIEADIVRRIKKAGEITETADWQLNRYLVLGHSTEDVENLIRQAVGDNDAEVQRLYDTVIEKEYTINKDLYSAVGKEFVPYENNYELQQMTNALIQQSSEELYNISKSLGFKVDMGGGRTVFTPLSDIYNGYIDDAMLLMASGAFDYNTLIRKVVGQLTASGLRSVDYASGWSNRADVAARRALLTGMSQLTGRISDHNGAVLGTQYFEVDWHGGARPDHAVWQGKVWTKQQLIDVCGLGTGAGLLGWNCRHTYYPFIPGVSVRNYSDQWLAEQNKREAIRKPYRGKEYNAYEATQKQRQMETAMRAQRQKVDLLKKGGADPDTITDARCKYQAMLDEYKEFSAKFKLPEQRERIYYDLRGRVAPSKQTYDKWRAEKAAKRAARERKADTAHRARAEQNRRADMDAARKNVTSAPVSATIKETYESRIKAASTISEARTFARDVLGLELENYDKVNIDAANLINREIAKVFDTFGNMHDLGKLNGVRLYPKRASWYAAYSPGWKEVFVKNVSSKDTIKKLGKDAAYQNKAGFWSTGEAAHAIRHELGHAVEYSLANGTGKLAEIEALRQKTAEAAGVETWSMNDTSEHMAAAGSLLSYYGLKDTGEFIAESVAEYMSGSPRETAKKVVQILLRKD